MDDLLHSFQTLKTIDGIEEYELIINAMRNMPETVEERVKYIHAAYVRYIRYVKYVDFNMYIWIDKPLKEFFQNYSHIFKMSNDTINDFYKLAKTIDHMIIVCFEDETRTSIDEEN